MVIGKFNVEIVGEVKIKCGMFETEAVIEFKEESLWKRDSRFVVEGGIWCGGEKCMGVEGKWNDSVYVVDYKNKKKYTIWSKSHQSTYPFNFSHHTLQLNYLSQQLSESLPPTDSRFRPDILALEHNRQ